METMDPAELEAAMAATGAIIEELTSTGAFVCAGGLMPPSSAITVDSTGESLSTVNSPFVEAPEYLGGFWVIDFADEEAAVGWAARAAIPQRSQPGKWHAPTRGEGRLPVASDLRRIRSCVPRWKHTLIAA